MDLREALLYIDSLLDPYNGGAASVLGNYEREALKVVRAAAASAKELTEALQSRPDWPATDKEYGEWTTRIHDLLTREGGTR